MQKTESHKDGFVFSTIAFGDTLIAALAGER
jgi:hypothetical protein